MFEIDGVYANRIGKYTVIAINQPKMTVRYEDGTEAELRISVQERIWENIEVEFRASELSKNKNKRRAIVGQDTKFYIKIVSISAGNDIAFAGWAEKVVMESLNETDPKLVSGDRLLYYVSEAKMFVAVATITGESKKAKPTNYFYKLDDAKRDFFPIDVDAVVAKLEFGAPVDSVELETQPNFRRMNLPFESLLEVNEDDFELVAELITEVVEEIEEEIDEDDEDYSEEDE
jgi:hypothetical protein